MSLAVGMILDPGRISTSRKFRSRFKPRIMYKEFAFQVQFLDLEILNFPGLEFESQNKLFGSEPPDSFN